MTIILVLCFCVTFLIFGQDKELTKEERRRETEIAKIYFSILNDVDRKKYLEKNGSL
jgi:uncharacterized membrane protein YsdA (DUF1294 family)